MTAGKTEQLLHEITRKANGSIRGEAVTPYKRHLVKDAAAKGGYKRLPSGAVLYCVCMNPERNHPQGFKYTKEAN